MKKTSLLIVLYSVTFMAQDPNTNEINETLDAWHRAAANADFDAYFGFMTEDAVFIGTDATENWELQAFKSYAKPHFDKGRAWSFTSVERTIYLNQVEDIAWFDELLDTQMKLCRGSGVLRKEKGKWKIAHYVLSIAVPNEYVGELIELKKEKDNMLLSTLSRN